MNTQASVTVTIPEMRVYKTYPSPGFGLPLRILATSEQHAIRIALGTIFPMLDADALVIKNAGGDSPWWVWTHDSIKYGLPSCTFRVEVVE